MARGFAQYLEITDASSIVRHRWQNYYLNSNVTYGGVVWNYQEFSADGLVDGQQTSLNVTMPATPLVLSMLNSAMTEGWLVEVFNYQFDMLISNTTPQSDQTLTGSFLGEVIGGRGGLYEVSMELGSSLAPVGAQFPPRKFTTRIMGSPCQF